MNKIVNNKPLYIYDDVFETHLLSQFYEFVLESCFKLSCRDTYYPEYKDPSNFSSNYSSKDIENMGFIQNLPEEIKNQFNLKLENVDRCMINAVTNSTSYHPHTDKSRSGYWTLLFYPHVKWNLEWGADTILLDNKRENIEYTIQCKPNRIAIFDATIPHMVRPPTVASLTPYRFSLNMVFGGNYD